MTVTPQDATPQDAPAYAIHELDHLTHTCPVDECERQVSNLRHLCDEHEAHLPGEIHAAREQAITDRDRAGFDAAWAATLAHLHTEVDEVDVAPEWERHAIRAARARDAASQAAQAPQDAETTDGGAPA